MVCPECRKGQHLRCKERSRQQNIGTGGTHLTRSELIGSAWCDCQHQVPKEDKSG